MKNILQWALLLVCVLFFNVPIKAPMIVVQGSVQLWPATIINNSNLVLIVVDEIIDPGGSSSMVRILGRTAPNNQFTFQWPSNFQKPNARRITIYGRSHAVNPTNRLIWGNTEDATDIGVVSGNRMVMSAGPNFICFEDPLNLRQCEGR